MSYNTTLLSCVKHSFNTCIHCKLITTVSHYHPSSYKHTTFIDWLYFPKLYITSHDLCYSWKFEPPLCSWVNCCLKLDSPRSKRGEKNLRGNGLLEAIPGSTYGCREVWQERLNPDKELWEPVQYALKLFLHRRDGAGGISTNSCLSEVLLPGWVHSPALPAARETESKQLQVLPLESHLITVQRPANSRGDVHRDPAASARGFLPLCSVSSSVK